MKGLTAMRKLFLLLLLSSPVLLIAQTSNYWSRNFNEESSLLSGAVVGGGATASAIYYNPAIISDIEESKLSFNASLFSFESLKAKNAYGEGIDLYDLRTYAIPRFVSYMIKLKKIPNWSLELAFLNTANYQVNNVSFVDKKIDILKNIPGEERYTASNNYAFKLRDDYLGIGGSRKLGEKWAVGASMFLSALSKYYYYLLDINAGPKQDFNTTDENNSYFTASYNEQTVQSFNDYRLLWKIGVFYKTQKFSAGVNITTPSVSGIYSDGEILMQKRSQSNITNEDTGEPIPNYLIVDNKENNDVAVNTKSPFSVAAGINYHNHEKTKSLFLTMEYFAGIDPYRTAQPKESHYLSEGNIFDEAEQSEWLTFIDGANPVFNVALGYRWIIKKDLMLLTGIRTDFNYKKNIDYMSLAEKNSFKMLNIDKYHFTGGLKLNVFGSSIIAGIQYTYGYDKNQKQFVNLSDPVEFNYDENKALQGTRQNSMNITLNALSLYFGGTINFGQDKKR
jgi:hypothetical protein